MRKTIVAALVIGALTAAVAAVIAIAGSVNLKTGPDADRAARAAVAAAGGDRAVSVDRDTERGATWEVEVVTPDGTVDVLLDAQFRVLSVDRWLEPNATTVPRSAGTHQELVPDREANRAAEVALQAVGGGTVEDVDLDAESGATYEVEITKPDGTKVDVLVDAQFHVISVGGEQEPNEGPDDNGEDSN